MADKDQVVASLASAADAARQAYLVALTANPTADLSALFAKEMAAIAVWSEAEKKALGSASGVEDAQAKLDEATKAIRSKLSTLKDIASWLAALDNLVKLATSVGAFFV